MCGDQAASRFTADPARNEAVMATRPKSKMEPKANVKLPVRSSKKPINGGPMITVGLESTLTNP